MWWLHGLLLGWLAGWFLSLAWMLFRILWARAPSAWERLRAWRPGQPRPELPEGMAWAKVYKPPSGWVNLHVRRETLELLGATAAKQGLAPAACVNALFERFGSWPEAERQAFVRAYLLGGLPEQVKGVPAEVLFLNSDGLEPQPGEWDVRKWTPKIMT
jgi:hypothetical protein